MSELVSIIASSALVVLVAVLLRNMLGGSPSPAPDSGTGEEAMRDFASVLQARDLTVPRTQDLAVMVLTLPDYAAMIRERPLEQAFHAVNVFYRIATEIADKHKGEVGSLVGGELCVLFGRILPVEKPFVTAVGVALEILTKLSTELPRELPGACRGASGAVTSGSALSGPVGGEWRRTYTSVGLPVDDAIKLAKEAPVGQLWIPEALAPKLDGFVLEPAAGGFLRVTAAKPASGSPPPA